MRSARFKAAAVEIDARAGSRAEALPLLSVSQTRGVIRRSEISGDPPRADDLSNYKVVTRNDIVLNRMSAYKGAVGIAIEDGICSPDYAVLRARDGWSPRYLGRLMASHWFVGEMSARLRGIGSIDGANVRTPRIAVADLGDIVVPPLSVNAQEAIADFLDRETAEINSFIADQEQLVALLLERREIAIAKATTVGLSAAGALQPSGVEWLGAVRADATVVRLRRLARVRTGTGDTVDAIDEGGVPFYVRSDVPLRARLAEFTGPAILTAGDGAGVGKVFHLVEGAFAAHQRVYVIDEFEGVLPTYLYYAFSSMFRRVALDGSAKSTVDSVRRWMVTDFPVVLPSIEEQKLVLQHLETETTEIDRVIADARRAVELSRERRAALISAAVTGKIDVTA